MACPSMPWGAENKRGVHLVSLYFRAATTVLCLVDIITIFLSDTTASHYWIYSVTIFTKVMQILLETMLAFLWF